MVCTAGTRTLVESRQSVIERFSDRPQSSSALWELTAGNRQGEAGAGPERPPGEAWSSRGWLARERTTRLKEPGQLQGELPNWKSQQFGSSQAGLGARRRWDVRGALW